MIKWLLQRVLNLLVILIAVLVVWTINYSSVQPVIDPVRPVEVPEQAVERLARTISMKTISDPNFRDSFGFPRFHAFLDSQFVLVDSFLEKDTINQWGLIYRWPGKNAQLAPILLAAHQDIVPVEQASLKNWTVPPYEGRIEGDYIWGRGTLDDKVSIMAILEAIELLLEEGYEPVRTVFLAFGQDEEIGGAKGAKSIAEYFKQQGIQFEYVLDEGSFIVKNALPPIEEPIALIGITQKGFATFYLKVTLEEGGHSSMPGKESAIGILSKAIHRLEDNPFPAKMGGAAEKLFEYAGPEMPLPERAIFANKWLFKPMILSSLSKSPASNAYIRTTMAPTIINAGIKDNVLPTEAEAKINCRILPGETIESVREQLKKIIDDERVRVELVASPFNGNPSNISEIDAFGFNVIQKTTKEIFPEVLIAPALVIATTDGRHYERVSKNVYRFLPAILDREDLKRIHGLNERISIKSYIGVIQFYHQLIQNSSK